MDIGVWVKGAVTGDWILIPRWLYEESSRYVDVFSNRGVLTTPERATFWESD